MSANLAIRSPPLYSINPLREAPQSSRHGYRFTLRRSTNGLCLESRRLISSSRCHVVLMGDIGGGEENEEKWREKVVHTLLIDNYDSYTYNIYQELAVVNGVPPFVIRNDEWTIEQTHCMLYEDKVFDNVVISPGPGSPSCPRDVGICLDIFLECKDVPILGVCLGHQALGYVHGADIVHAPEPVHGRLSEIEHNGCNIFCGIPSGKNSGFKVVRYHSLIIDAKSLPKELIPVAWTSTSIGARSSDVNDFRDTDGRDIIMGIKHFTRPHYGVQFHPESISTCHGRQIFENFKKITVGDSWRSLRHERKVSYACQSTEEVLKLLDNKQARPSPSDIWISPSISLQSFGVKYLKLQWKKIDCLASQVGGSDSIFCHLFGDKNAENTFWLDSSSTDKGRARFSFMGGKGGSLWKQLTFQLEGHSKQTNVGGYLSIQDRSGYLQKRFIPEGFLHFLNKELQSFHHDKEDYEGLPFDFCGGHVGFIGYNLKTECGASFNRYKSATPDACFFFADRLVVIDHKNDDVYILSLHDIHNPTRSQEHQWLIETEKRLLRLKGRTNQKANIRRAHTESHVPLKESFSMEKTRFQYIKDVHKCLKLIKDGESYELCLTTQMRKKVESIDYLKLYLSLREKNPAPYAAWLNFAEENLCICSSSPERFLRLDGEHKLEAKPIKGTIARGRTVEEDENHRIQLQFSEKDRAENLMIVDLLRNDLGRVCEPGSVHVPKLMEVESYATVHTMVSTIQGKKLATATPIDCVRAAFPGGSMTGAPKLRSMELLDSIESSSRGVYSGSIGFFSYNQTFDLNIVIRTVVIHNGEASVGAGGAVIAMSNPEEEYDEMMLKAKAPTGVVDEWSRNADYSGTSNFNVVV